MDLSSPEEVSKLRQKLEEQWIATAKNFRSKTERDLDKPAPSLDDLLKQLAARDEPKEQEEKESKKRAIENVEIALKCLLEVGKVGLKIAEAASMSYPPATFCISAVSYLIEVPHTVKKFYTRLAELFQEVAFFLRQFKIYEDIEKSGNMTAELLESTQDLICGFVDICAKAYKPITENKLKRVLRASKFVFLDDDSGLQGALDGFEKLVRRQDSTVGVISLEYIMREDRNLTYLLDNQQEDRERLLEMAQSLRALSEDSARRRENEENTMKIEKLSRKFGISYEDEVRNQRDRLDRLFRRSVRTGSWMKDHEVYRDWLDYDTARSALYLCGAKDTGKTNLIPTILQDIAEETTPNRKLFTAVYLFGREEDKRTSSDDVLGNESSATLTPHENDSLKSESRLSVALRSMALQLAEKSEDYLDSLHNSQRLAPQVDFGEMPCSRLFEALRFSAKRSRVDREPVFYMIFDDLEPGQAVDELVAKVEALRNGSDSPMSPKLSVSNVRILIIGNSRNLTTIPKELNAGFTRIDISPEESGSNMANAQDLGKYIRHTIRVDGTLKDAQRTYYAFFEQLYPALIRTSKGNFRILDNKIGLMRDAIDNGLQDIEHLKKIAEADPQQDESILVSKVFHDLESNLVPEDIAQINRVIAWYFEGFQWFSVEEMDAIVELDRTLKTVQLFSFKVRTKKRFQNILEIIQGREERVKFQDQVWRSIGDMKWSELEEPKAATMEDSTITMELKISFNNAELSDVQRFFWDLNEKASFGRFDFEHTRSKITEGPKIHTNREEGNSIILVNCLNLLNGDASCKVSSLLSYAARRIMWHFVKAKNIELELEKMPKPLDLPEKKRIVSGLIRFFMNPENSVNHLKHCNRDDRKFWARGDVVASLDQWINVEELKDTPVKERLRFRKFLSENGTPTSYHTPLILEFALKWLTDKEWSASDCFDWVDGFLAVRGIYQSESDGEEQAKSLSPIQKTLGNQDKAFAIDVGKRIILALDWIKKTLPSCEEDEMYHRRVGRTYFGEDIYDKAIEHFDAALQLRGSDDADIRYDMALAHAGMSDLENALKNMKQALELWSASGNVDADDTKNSKLGQRKMAEWYAKLGNPERALKSYDKLLSLDSSNYYLCFDLLMDMREFSWYQRTGQFLRDLERDEYRSGTNRLVDFLKYLANRSNDYSELDLHKLLFMAHKAGEINTVRGALEKLLEEGDQAPSAHRAYTIAALGSTLFLRDRSGSRRETIVYYERARSEFLASGSTQTHFTTHVEARLLSHYYVEAQRAGFPSKTLEKTLEEACAHDDGPITYMYLRTFAVSYFSRTGQIEKARALQAKEIGEAFALLTDDTPKNDWDGYSKLAEALGSVGDSSNALAAMSLIGPDDQDDSNSIHEGSVKGDGERTDSMQGSQQLARKGRKGPMYRYCDGMCGKAWTFSDDILRCEICPDVDFCRVCWQELQDGTASFLACDKEHSWFHIPPWSDEERDTVGKDRVRIPTKTRADESKFREGEIVSIDEWLNRIRDIWGIARPDNQAKEEDKESAGSNNSTQE